MATVGGPVQAEKAKPWEKRATAVLWVGDTVRAVGGDDEVRKLARLHGIEPEDAGGALVLPGFVDAHTHFLHVGVKRTRPDLRGARSKEEALQRVTDFLVSHPGDAPVIAEGWDESGWQDAEFPTREDVDRAVAAAAGNGAGPAGRAVIFRRICGHIAVASSGALPALQKRWKDGVDAASGLLEEAPSLYLNEVFPTPPAELDAALKVACDVAHRLGVTAVGDYAQAPYRAALQRAAARGTLDVRTFSSIYVQQLEAEAALGFRTGRPGLAPQDLSRKARQRLDAGPNAAGAVVGEDGGDPDIGGHSPWLRDGGLKVFLDGSLGGHTAHLREPYCDHAEHPQGTPIWTDGQVREHFAQADAAGIQVHAHAIGDAAIDQGLAAFRDLAAELDAAELEADAEDELDPEAEADPDDEGRAEDRPGAAAATAQEGNEGPSIATAMLSALGGRSALASRLAGTSTPAAESLPPGQGPMAGIMPGVEAPVPVHAGAADDGPFPLRHRFEHFEIVHDDQADQVARLGIVASSQPNFVGEWSAKGGMYEARLGDRFRLSNRFRTFKEKGIALAFGSDGMPFGPLLGLASAVRHSDPTQNLGVAEAVWHYTWVAAWAIHWEEAIGSLEPGKKADLNVYEAADKERPETWVLKQSITGGVTRYTGGSCIPSL
jgi:predicted amidohydrolase YtcJ